MQKATQAPAEFQPTFGLGRPATAVAQHGASSRNDKGSGNATGTGSSPRNYRLGSITLPDGVKRINPYEVASLFGDHHFFGTPQLQLNHIEQLNRVATNLIPGWADRDLPEMNIGELMIHVRQAIEGRVHEAFKGRNVQLLYAPTDPYNERKREFFLLESPSDWDGSCRFVQMPFLPQLRRENRKLYNLIIAVIGHVVKKVNMPLWDELYDRTIDYMEETLECGELESPEKKVWADAIKDYKKGISTTMLKEIYSAPRHFSRKDIEATIKTIRWNTHFKKRLLVWIRSAQRLVDGAKGKINNYVDRGDFYGEKMAGDEMYAFNFCGNWRIGEMWHEEFNERFGNAEQEPLCRKVSAEYNYRGLKPDPTIQLIDTFMIQGCFLFDENFLIDWKAKPNKRKLRRSRKLLDIIDDDDSEYVDIGNGVIADREFVNDLRNR